MSSLKKTLLLLALSTPAHAGVALPGGASTKEFPTCGVRISLGNGAGFHCEADPAATEHAGKKIAFACCDADMGYSTCTRADADGECYAGFLNSVSHFAPKTYHEATNVCAAEGKVLCGVEQPCMNKGCYYNYHYQWTGEECQAGDAGLPAACVSTVQPTAKPTARPTPRPTIKPTAAPTARPTPRPTIKPTAAPTAKPTAGPTPAVQPTIKPTAAAPTGGEGVCGFMNVPVTMDECPANPDIPKNCKQAACNELCEGDGECGTRTGQNNCGPFDVYRKWCEDTPEPTPKPTPAPSPAPSPKPTSDGRGICGVANIPVGQWPHHRESCPANPDLPNCQVVQCGELCEGDGECGTFGGLNNCGPYDVYRKWCETPPIAPTASPTETPICEVSAITPADPSKFNIQLVRFGAPSAYDALFQEAADRWASFISRDLPAYGALGKDWFLGAFCGEYTGPVDDVVVGYEVGYIDGRYGVLGRAGARYISGSRPFSGIMKFDAVDMDAYDDARRKLIILHEMGHILGLVETTGSRCSNDCPNTGDTSYTCPKALAEYAALGLGPNTLRLENDGGGGTKCKHWDEDSFAVAGSSELMTGGFEAGLYQPISRMTVAALDDLGVYGPLNYDAADPYPATRRKLEEGPGFEVLTPTESFTLDGDDEYVVEVEPVPLDA